MIVSSMSFDEVRIIVFKEMIEMNNRAAALVPGVIREFHKTKIKKGVKKIPMESASKNRWFLLFKYDAEVNMQEVVLSVLAIVNDSHGFHTINPMNYNNEGIIVIQTAHFYSRYNERNKLGLINTLDIIKHFHKHHVGFSFDAVQEEREKNPRRVIATLSSGLMLGLEYPDQRTVIYKTFVTNDMLFDKQKEIREYQWNSTLQHEVEDILDPIELKLIVQEELRKMKQGTND